VAGVRIRAPMMRIHTVAAGGGSILHYADRAASASGRTRRRQPRPGLLPPRRAADRHRRQRHARQAATRILPAIFGPDGQDQPLDADAVREKFTERWPKRSATARRPRTWPKASSRIAVENMANAIKKISVQRGYDVTQYALLNCFGGAGGQHACLMADALGMKTVLIHPFSGLLSAYGMGLASIYASRHQALVKTLAEDSLHAMEALIDVLARACSRKLKDQGVPMTRQLARPMLHLRYEGTDTTIPGLSRTAISQPPAPSSRPRTRRSSASSTRPQDRHHRGVSVEGIDATARTDGPSPNTRSTRREPRRGNQTGLCRRQMARCALRPPRPAQPGNRLIGPCADHRTQPDGCRAGLAGGNHRPRPSRADPRSRSSHRALAIGTRPTRSCWRCSTTCSCRSPSRWA
jgi:N-methylhydantoinase A/oxoprolinase/acetone carboxylase beta subunit